MIQFIKHVSSKHNPDQPVDPAWKCSWCFGLTFEDEESLKKHKNEVHVREKTHRCEICDKTFASNVQLRKHHAVNHEGEKVLLHSLIRGILTQSCSTGAENFTKCVFYHVQFSGVIQNIAYHRAIFTLFVYVNYYQNNQFY